MLLDILIGVPLIVFIIFGVRDGIVRKLVAIIVIIIGLILGQYLMHPFGVFLTDNAGISRPKAPMYAFLIIFVGLFLIQSFLYKLLSDNYKIGGIADRVGGTILGFIEGALFISSLLFILALAGFPSRETRRDTRFYKAFVNIAPQILEFTTSQGQETAKTLKEMGTPGTSEKSKDNKVNK